MTFLQPKFHTKVPENLGIGTRLLALPTNRPGRYLRYIIPDKSAAELFSIGAIGEIVLQKSLDFEKSARHTFNVIATDDVSNATAEVNIDVLDVNDWEPRFRQNHYDFVIPKAAKINEPVPLGKLEAADGDVNDKVSITIRGSHAYMFEIQPDGMLWLKQHKSNLTLMHLIATATDTGIPPRSSSVPVTITMEGVALARSSYWAPGVLGAFGGIVILFILVVVAMSVYIYKQKRSTTKTRVHSQNTNGGTAATTNGNLMNHEKFSATHLHGGNIRLANPLNNNNNNILGSGSGSSISAGASTILAASLEREAQQRERDREKETYTATVRSIISRASAARGGINYDGDMDRDSINNSDIDKPAWTLSHGNSPQEINRTTLMQTARNNGWTNVSGPSNLLVNGKVSVKKTIINFTKEQESVS